MNFKHLQIIIIIIFVFVIIIQGFMINRANNASKISRKQTEKIILHYKEGGYIQYQNGFHILTVVSDYRRIGDLERAMAWCNVFFVDGMQSDSKSAKHVAFLLRASLFTDMNNYKDAINDYTLAISYDDNPKDYRNHLLRAQAHRLSGNNNKAIDDYIVAVLNARYDDNDEHIATYSFPVFKRTIPPAALIEYLKNNRGIYDAKNKASNFDHVLDILANSILSYESWVVGVSACPSPTGAPVQRVTGNPKSEEEMPKPEEK